MAIALIAGTDIEAASSDAEGFTTASCDTTGANLIVLGFSYYTGFGTPTVSDSKSNTYTGLTLKDNSGYVVRIFYCASPTVGSGHTFSVSSGTSNYSCLFVSAWSGAAASPFDQENGNNAGSGATIQPGSITPTDDGALVITAVTGNVSPSDPSSINGGFATQITGHFANATFNVAGGMAYDIQGSKAATNPTWTFTGNAPANSACAIASFAAATGGGGGKRRINRRMLLGVG